MEGIVTTGMVAPEDRILSASFTTESPRRPGTRRLWGNGPRVGVNIPWAATGSDEAAGPSDSFSSESR